MRWFAMLVAKVDLGGRLRKKKYCQNGYKREDESMQEP
jgi:hypothetical protein